MSFLEKRHLEWLEADGLGGFASGTVSGVRTRRYHALLLTATPSGRMVLVNGLEIWLETLAGTFAISTQMYQPGVFFPHGAGLIEDFSAEPFPRWTFHLPDGSRIRQEIFVPHGSALVGISWRREGAGPATLGVRPLLSGRDYHALHHGNPAFRFDPACAGARVTWRPYSGVPATVAESNGTYQHSPDWYRNFVYEQERDRGLDDTEDLASPGMFKWDLLRNEAYLLLAADRLPPSIQFASLRAGEERRRASFPNSLQRSADAYLVQSGTRRTIIAGYPWFTDWGRDTFIALRGLCLSTGRLDIARDILLDWSGTVSDGMLPNRFPDGGQAPEFNSVDASLWYVIAVHSFLEKAETLGFDVTEEEKARLIAAVSAILMGYTRGTRFDIQAETDGLLSAGVPGTQLTWMDAKVGDWVVTPRIGKPVEVQALWLNALSFGARFSANWRLGFERGLRTFRERFWDENRGCLFDVVDCDHTSGVVDRAVRPNQLLAVGGLPLCLLDASKARRVVDTVESQLLTPLGPRSLSPSDPAYRGYYRGGVIERDGAYHQGAVWPWLMGPFVEAWVRVRGSTPEARKDARRRFLEPLLGWLEAAGLGHLPEIADGELPHVPRGCPFQAWSLAEALRLHLDVLAENESAAEQRNGEPSSRAAVAQAASRDGRQ